MTGPATGGPPGGIAGDTSGGMSDADVPPRSRTEDRRADLRLLPVAGAVYAASWLALVVPFAVALAGCSALAVGGGVGLRTRRTPRGAAVVPSNRRSTLCAMLLCAAGGGISGALHALIVRGGPLPPLAARQASVPTKLRIAYAPRRIAPPPGIARPPLVLVPARLLAYGVTAARGAVGTAGAAGAVAVDVPVTVMVSGYDPAVLDAWLPLLPSTRVTVAGRLQPESAEHPDAALLLVHRPPVVVGDPSLVQQAAGRLRAALRDAVRGLPPDERGLIPGLLIGDTRDEPPSLADAFRATGLTYLTVVSGENLVLTLGAVLPLVRRAGIHGRVVNIAGAAVVIGFTILARPEPAMVRATVMALLALGATALGRSRPGLPLLCAATIVLTLADPWLTRQYGFALSLAAMAGLCLAARPCAIWLAYRRVPLRVAESIACAFAAELFCLPLIVTFAGGITLLAVPASMLAQPAVGPVTVLAALALVGDLLWHPLGAGLAWLAQWPTAWIVAVARVGARVPGAWVPWPGHWQGTAALLASYALAWALFAPHRRPPANPTGAPTPEPRP